MADVMETVRQDVHKKAPDELVGVEGHELRLPMLAIVLPAERDLAIFHADQM